MEAKRICPYCMGELENRVSVCPPCGGVLAGRNPAGSLPVGTRSGISALRQIDKSIEESAYDMGADSFKVFMTVTLPLIKDSFLSGLVTAFVRSITAISAIILLVTPQFLLITVQINEFAEKGSYSLACAFATILIVITYGAVLLMNLFMNHFGTSKKMKED